MKPQHLWVLELKEGDRWMATVYVALTRRDMTHVKKDFLYNNSTNVVRVRKYEAKA